MSTGLRISSPNPRAPPPGVTQAGSHSRAPMRCRTVGAAPALLPAPCHRGGGGACPAGCHVRPSGRPARSYFCPLRFHWVGSSASHGLAGSAAAAGGSQSHAQCLFSVPLAPLPDQRKPHGAQALGSANSSLPRWVLSLAGQSRVSRGGASGCEGPRADVHFKAPQAQRLRAPLPPRAAPSARRCGKRDRKQAPRGHSEVPRLVSGAGGLRGETHSGPIQILAVDALPLGKHAQGPAAQRRSLCCFPPPRVCWALAATLSAHARGQGRRG